ncbi:Ig-like domain-containing protein [Maribacter sp. MMG018]|uniref:Ig-like domain-containing protein n=1 Tax=Maribacter sp. MMG018 TaxID=2822688 RepID=UPI001B385FD8|nr:Ig-like domain-containing protein [Maribacter sp. MMG018]MBQ4913135.1 Ig-like domain-containing protein [Maribacter sp. MMG018]
MLRRFLAYIFVVVIIFSFFQCARKGSPTGGPKDVTPPVLTKAEPENMSINFKEKKIRLYFDELVKLKDVQEQLIVSPPLKYQPTLAPQGSASKYIEITLKDTLLENTTYTLNFGQSIVDNNEGNPNSFFTYVFSTGSYIDSLELKGVVKDAFNKKADDFISVMLYSIDSTYTDSTVYTRPPNYITNTLDSTIIFNLKNLKEGKYALFGLKDASKNNVFDQKTDKIAFIRDTVNLPTDSIYLLTLFKEVPDYGVTVPSLVSKNKISFGYYGKGEDIKITPISKIPDTVKTTILKERDKDTLNFWFTPYEMDSLVFTVTNENLKVIDTFTIKNRKAGIDSLKLSPTQKSTLHFEDKVSILANTPLVSIDSSKIGIMDKDSLMLDYSVSLDSTKNQLDFDFKIEPNQVYQMQLLPGAVLDFFDTTNDTINYSLATKSYADYGDLTVNLSGNNIEYPLIVQLTNDKEELQREIFADEPQLFEFNNLPPGNYMIRVIFDQNKNLKWDTGNYLKKIQPEKVSYYPNIIEMRANWIENVTFNILD